MKPFFYALAWLLALTTHWASAQTIANGTLEAWATPYGPGSAEAPTGWLTTDDLLAYFSNVPRGSYNTGTVTKSTDAREGTYAAKLTTTSVPTTGASVVLPGYLLLGAKTGVYEYYGIPIGGAPTTGRPNRLTFSYKLTGPATDSASVFVYLTTTQAGVPSVVGQGYQLLAPTTAGYLGLTVPITYDPAVTTVADSVHVLFSSGDALEPTVGTTLLVDNVGISGTTAATRVSAATQELLAVAPNPSPAGRFVISSPTRPGLAAAPLTVLDALGRTVAQQPAQAAPTATRPLDLSHLPLGIYILHLATAEGILTRQLVVE
jgi:hypothetical protein